MSTIKTNFLVELATPTPRRWTSYRGMTADGRRGLIVGGHYYASTILEVPSIDDQVNAPPITITLSIGNAEGIATDLVYDQVNQRAAVTITRLRFADSPWSAEVPPANATTEIWFEGFTGRASFRGQRVTLDCHADVGRRGKSPARASSSLMTAHTPPPANWKLTIVVTR
jgi:hypothetical protein